MSSPPPQPLTLTLTCLCTLAKTSLPLPTTTPPLTAAFCHCTSCRHLSGCLCLTSIPLPTYTQNTQVLEDLSKKLQGFEFSMGRIWHYFCGVCGSHVVARVRPKYQVAGAGEGAGAERWFGMCGVLSAEGEEVGFGVRHEYVGDTGDGGLSCLVKSWGGREVERWVGHPGEGEEGWIASESTGDGAGEKTLQAHCKCERVNFLIPRPAHQKKLPIAICPCTSCHLSTGMSWISALFALIPSSLLSWTSSTMLRTYVSPSSGFKHNFCGSCGATVSIQKDGEEALRVAIGLFDAAEGARAETWLDWEGLEVPVKGEEFGKGVRRWLDQRQRRKEAAFV